MASGDGPPTRNTRLAAHTVRNTQARREQNTPHSKDALSNANAHSERPASHKGSALTSVVGSFDNEQRQSEEDDTPSEHGTIHKQTEEVHDQEQSYTTAPGSFGPSLDPAGLGMTSSAAHTSRGNQCITTRSPCSEEDFPPWSQRVASSPLAHNEEDMGQLREALTHWTAIAERNRVEASGIVDAMHDMGRTVNCIIVRVGGQHVPPNSPCALASRALFAECGSNEGTIDYECCQSVQACFTVPRMRNEGMEQHSLAFTTRATREESNHSSYARTKESSTPSECYKVQMAES